MKINEQEQNETRKGSGFFTLIELLVVVSIIAILAGLLLPSLNAAKEMAHTSACMNNLKQHGTILQFYANDYSDWMIPIQCTWNGTTYVWYNLYENAVYMPAGSSSSLAELKKYKWLYCSRLMSTSTAIDQRYGMNSLLTSYQFVKIHRLVQWNINQGVFADDIHNTIRRQAYYFSPSSFSGPTIHLRHNKKAVQAFLGGNVATRNAEELKKAGYSAWSY